MAGMPHFPAPNGDKLEEVEDDPETMTVDKAKPILVDLFKTLQEHRTEIDTALAKVEAMPEEDRVIGRINDVVPIIIKYVGIQLHEVHLLPPARLRGVHQSVRPRARRRPPLRPFRPFRSVPSVGEFGALDASYT